MTQIKFSPVDKAEVLVWMTEYILPDGRRNKIVAPVAKSLEPAATRLTGRGVHFDIEILRTGAVSITAELDELEDTDDGPVLAHEICPNKEGVVDLALARLIENAAARLP